MAKRKIEPRLKVGDVVKLRNGLIGTVQAGYDNGWRGNKWTVITSSGHRVEAEDEFIEPLNAIERLAMAISEKNP